MPGGHQAGRLRQLEGRRRVRQAGPGCHHHSGTGQGVQKGRRKHGRVLQCEKGLWYFSDQGRATARPRRGPWRAAFAESPDEQRPLSLLHLQWTAGGHQHGLSPAEQYHLCAARAGRPDHLPGTGPGACPRPHGQGRYCLRKPGLRGVQRVLYAVQKKRRVGGGLFLWPPAGELRHDGRQGAPGRGGRHAGRGWHHHRRYEPALCRPGESAEKPGRRREVRRALYAWWKTCGHAERLRAAAYGGGPDRLPQRRPPGRQAYRGCGRPHSQGHWRADQAGETEGWPWGKISFPRPTWPSTPAVSSPWSGWPCCWLPMWAAVCWGWCSTAGRRWTTRSTSYCAGTAWKLSSFFCCAMGWASVSTSPPTATTAGGRNTAPPSGAPPRPSERSTPTRGPPRTRYWRRT